MPNDALGIDLSRLAAFHVVEATDATEMDGLSRVSERFPASSRMYKYRLKDRSLWRMRSEGPIFGLAIRSAGAIMASYGASRYTTEIAIDGAADDYFGFATMMRGQMSVFQNGEETTGGHSHGLAYRTGPGTRIMTSDDSLRMNVFLRVADVEDALEHMLDEHCRRPLALRTSIDWGRGLAAGLKGQFDLVAREFERPDGLAGNAVAIASMTDLLCRLVLLAVPHNYTSRLDAASAGAVPAYVRRAEEFMRAHCAEPIRIAQVAAAAGCSVRTLEAVFRQFRGSTPLGTLQGIRLEQVRQELRLDGAGATVAAVARRYGFTNASRFGAAFRRRFGEAPSDVVRRAAR